MSDPGRQHSNRYPTHLSVKACTSDNRGQSGRNSENQSRKRAHSQPDQESSNKRFKRSSGKSELCTYCGDDISEKDLHRENGDVYHQQCIRKHKPRCTSAAAEFKDLIAPEGCILLMAIHVSYLYGQGKADRNNKWKRTAKIKELLDKVSAARNSGSGHILIHLVGLKSGDNYTGAFDEFVDVKLTGLINDGTSFDDVFKKNLLSASWRFEQFTDIIVLTVQGSNRLITSDFKTKSALDNCIVDTPDHTLLKCIQSRRQFTKKHPKVKLENSSDLSVLRENRNIQLKAWYESANRADTVVETLFDNLKLAEYISAFTKLVDGGSYLVGIAEKQYEKNGYYSQELMLKPVTTANPFLIYKYLKLRLLDALLICDYDGNSISDQYPVDDVARDVGLVKLDLIPARQLDPKSAHEDAYVMRVSVRPVSGIVFYDKSGPVAYKIDKDTNSLIRLTVKEWFRAFNDRREQGTQTTSI